MSANIPNILTSPQAAKRLKVSSARIRQICQETTRRGRPIGYKLGPIWLIYSDRLREYRRKYRRPRGRPKVAL